MPKSPRRADRTRRRATCALSFGHAGVAAMSKPKACMNKEKLKALLAEYGSVAIYTYLVLFAVVLIGFALAIKIGIKLEGTASGVGLLGAAWVATKLTQPLRILATVALTPIVARVWNVRKKELPSTDG